jgi:hypothetical protein
MIRLELIGDIDLAQFLSGSLVTLIGGGKSSLATATGVTPIGRVAAIKRYCGDFNSLASPWVRLWFRSTYFHGWQLDLAWLVYKGDADETLCREIL